MITSRMRASNVGLANNSSTMSAHPPKTLGALASNRNTLRLPRRAAHWRIGSDCSSRFARGIRDIVCSLSLGREGESPVQGHKGHVDGGTVRGGARIVAHEVGLQRVLVGE